MKSCSVAIESQQSTSSISLISIILGVELERDPVQLVPQDRTTALRKEGKVNLFKYLVIRLNMHITINICIIVSNEIV